MLIFILSHIMYTENVSVNLRIMTVCPFLPSQYSSNAVWVTSVAFLLIKIIAQQENKSFQIVSWHKHFGSFLYYNWKGKQSWVSDFFVLLSCERWQGFYFFQWTLLSLLFIASAVANFKGKKKKSRFSGLLLHVYLWIKGSLGTYWYNRL